MSMAVMVSKRGMVKTSVVTPAYAPHAQTEGVKRSGRGRLPEGLWRVSSLVASSVSLEAPPCLAGVAGPSCTTREHRGTTIPGVPKSPWAKWRESHPGCPYPVQEDHLQPPRLQRRKLEGDRGAWAERGSGSERSPYTLPMKESHVRSSGDGCLQNTHESAKRILTGGTQHLQNLPLAKNSTVSSPMPVST